jgi:hypothetical protein
MSNCLTSFTKCCVFRRKRRGRAWRLWLPTGLQENDSDSLLRLAGVLDSALADIDERHDYYLGRRIEEKMKPDGGS